ncbi:MAG: acetolactate synthase large subunit [Candidatus Eremiobacteraeota bacterium]|nr:acetolactate synthase large subunit [Candidatus Eremiobacteraeota bacterium]
MTDHRLIISSGNERHGTGLFSLHAGSVERIDFLPGAGLHQRGRLFYRIWSQHQYQRAEMLVYDDGGVRSYLRLDDVHTPHDVTTLDDGTVVGVAPGSNAIVAIAPDGSTRTVWSAAAPFDAWHVNCATVHEGRLYATAFGRFDRTFGWNANCDGTGILFDTETNEDVVTGLTQPHTPRWIDGAWTVCDSGSGAVVRAWPDGRRRRVEVGGFPRGLCAVDDRVYVGVSDWRTSREQTIAANIVVLDRRTWNELERIPMGAGSVYDIVSVDEATWGALQIGFGFACRRRDALNQLAMFEEVGVTPVRLWAVGARLEREGCRITIDAAVPAAWTVDDGVSVPCTVTNHGNALLVSAPPHPVLLSYKWFDAAGALLPAISIRTPLPAALPPGESEQVDVLIAAPAEPGRYTLTVTALQEFIHWFDEVEAASAFRAPVAVGTKRKTLQAR